MRATRKGYPYPISQARRKKERRKPRKRKREKKAALHTRWLQGQRDRTASLVAYPSFLRGEMLRIVTELSLN
jgi:hypothetical protein